MKKAVRELEREKIKAERDQAGIKVSVKREFKKGNHDMAKMHARDLVRSRNHTKRLHKSKMQMEGLSRKLDTVKSHEKMADVLKNVTKVLVKINKKVNIASTQKILMEFSKQSDMMDMMSEGMDDLLDDELGESDEEAESEEIISKIFDELGLEMANVPMNKLLLNLPVVPVNIPQSNHQGGPPPKGGGGGGIITTSNGTIELIKEIKEIKEKKENNNNKPTTDELLLARFAKLQNTKEI